MSDATTSETTTETQKPKPFDPNNPDMTTPRRCRALTVKGIQCNQSAMKGQDYCIAHFERAPRTLGKPGHIAVPLLEDHAAVTLMCTKILHGLLNGELDPAIARPATSVLKVASLSLPKPPRAKASDKPAPVQESVHNYSMDEEGNWIGPREAYRGPNNTFEPQWSAAKYMYEQQCKRYGMPLPESAADFPECGWLTEEEIKMDPREWSRRQNRRLDAVLEQAKKDEAARAKARDERKLQADKEAGIEPAPAPKPLRHGEALGYYDPIPEKKPAVSITDHATSDPAKAQPKAASDPSAEPTHPPFPIPGVPMTCPDEENGVCWCGGPNQQFPCEPCRLKRDANNLDLKAVAEPRNRVPHSGARRRSARQDRAPGTLAFGRVGVERGIARNLMRRFSEPGTLQPVTCSPVVESVTTSKNHIPTQIKTVTPKKLTVSNKKTKGSDHSLPLLTLDELSARYYAIDLKATAETASDTMLILESSAPRSCRAAALLSRRHRLHAPVSRSAPTRPRPQSAEKAAPAAC
jgi:hypothetical protein